MQQAIQMGPHQLDELCCVCGSKLHLSKKKGDIFSCIAHKGGLELAFHLDTSEDAHPKNFCLSCYATMRHAEKRAKEGVPYNHSTVVYEWTAHTESDRAVKYNNVCFELKY